MSQHFLNNYHLPFANKAHKYPLESILFILLNELNDKFWTPVQSDDPCKCTLKEEGVARMGDTSLNTPFTPEELFREYRKLCQEPETLTPVSTREPVPIFAPGVSGYQNFPCNWGSTLCIPGMQY